MKTSILALVISMLFSINLIAEITPVTEKSEFKPKSEIPTEVAVEQPAAKTGESVAEKDQARHNRQEAAKKAKKAKEEEFRTGHIRRTEIHKNNATFFNPPGATGPVARTKEDIKRYVEAMRSGQSNEIRVMTNDQKFRMVDKGTKIKVMNLGQIYSNIRILDGKYKEKMGWVLNEMLGITKKSDQIKPDTI